MRIKVYVDEQAAIRDGGTRSGNFELDLDFSGLTPEQRGAIADARDYRSGQGCWLPDTGNLTQDTLAAWADRLIAGKQADADKQTRMDAERTASNEAFAQKLLGFSDAELVAEYISERYDPGVTVRKDPRLADVLSRRQAIMDAGAAEKKSREKTEAEIARQAQAEARTLAQAKQIAEEAQAQAKAAQRAAWVAEHGTQSQRERLAAGMLAVSEVEAAMRDEAFGAITLPIYEGTKKSDLDHNEEYGEHALRCNVTDAKSATPEQWTVMEAIKAALPSAVITIRNHHCYCNEDDCDATLDRYGIKGAIAVGHYRFIREYAAPDA